MPIWKHTPALADVNALLNNTIADVVGLQITEIGEDFLAGTMPVDKRTHQPMGILHGGASVVLAETLGSLAASLCLEKGYNCVGLDINANHIRGVSEGIVRGVAKPIHIGRRTHVWEIRIANEADKTVCISRLTMAVIET
jgi:1,4-dihydroxy-2-naphthoyl-CoA hydrolase